MAKAVKAKNITYTIPPSSYTLQTADNVLRHYGIAFSKQEILDQLMNQQSFYRKLLQVPALIIHNENLFNQCRDTQFYCAEQVINIIFATNSAKAEHPTAQSPISRAREQQICQLQDRNDELDEQLQQFKKKHAYVIADHTAIAQKTIKEWKQLVAENTDKIINTLQEMGFDLSPQFHQRLLANLEKQGAGIEINQHVLTEYDIKQQLSALEKAVLSTLIAEAKHDYVKS